MDSQDQIDSIMTAVAIVRRSKETAEEAFCAFFEDSELYPNFDRSNFYTLCGV